MGNRDGTEMGELVREVEMPKREPPAIIGDHQQPVLSNRWSLRLKQSPPQMRRGDGEEEEVEEDLDELDLDDEFDGDDDDWGDPLDDDEVV